MSETGRDAAACGLSILTHMPDACREILKVLRVRPFVGYMMLQYVPLAKTSYEFQTRWKNMKAMHLPGHRDPRTIDGRSTSTFCKFSRSGVMRVVHGATKRPKSRPNRTTATCEASR